MARPKIKIDGELVRQLAGIFCTMKEIASIVGCSVDTLERRFADVIDKGRDHGKMSIKRKQFETAMLGNTRMLTWLGEQHCDQKRRTEVSSSPDQPINITYTLANGASTTPPTSS
jgi:hypothetical protein